jgi:flagellar protein FlgJ
MRSAAIVDEASHNSTIDFYQEMYDKQLSLSISKQGGLGIARVLMQQLPGGDQVTLDTGKGGKLLPIDTVPQITKLTVLKEPSSLLVNISVPSAYQTDSYQTENPAVKVSKLQSGDSQVNETPYQLNQAQLNNAQTQHEIGSEQRWNKPAHFVSDLWPHVEQAANAIGVSAQALVAQSALETGWGKHSMRYPDGKSTFNLFGIKAGSSWTGATLTKPTIEFREGVMQTEIAHFRAYDSIPDALDDYVDFIQSSSRYQSALDHQGSDTHYLQKLQQGGYATDPQYANKIINIMQGRTLEDSLASLHSNQTPAINEENNHA